MHPFSLTSWLASLTVLQVAIGVLAATAVRIAAVSHLRRKSGSGPLRGVSRGVVEVADSLLYAFAVAFLLIKPLIAQPYYIPTGSMEPTLRGDRHDMDRVWVKPRRLSQTPPCRAFPLPHPRRPL